MPRHVQSEAITRLNGIVSAARSFGSTHAQLLADRERVFADLPKRTPRHVHSYLRGYFSALTDGLYRTDLVFGGYVDGRFVSTHKDRADYYETLGISPREYADDGRVTARGHYWTHNLKPYFTGTETAS